MVGRLDRDEAEEKKCNDHRYGKKLKSYRLGYLAGKIDSRKSPKSEIGERAQNPYRLNSAILELLRKRARWEAGYVAGWEKGRAKRRKKV